MPLHHVAGEQILEDGSAWTMPTLENVDGRYFPTTVCIRIGADGRLSNPQGPEGTRIYPLTRSAPPEQAGERYHFGEMYVRVEVLDWIAQLAG